MSEHTSVLLVNRRQQRLRYERNTDVVFLDAERITLRSRAQQAVFWLLITSLGSVVSHDEICEMLNSVGSGDSNELPNTRSAKFVSNLRSELERNGDLRDFVRTVRSKGYIVDDNWTKPEVSPSVEHSNDFLSMLDRVVEDCIDHVNQRQVSTCRNGLQYIDFDSNFAIQKFLILNTMLWDIILALSMSAKTSDIIAIKNTFHDLSSYVLFWRLGDELTERKWKSDYQNEISTLARILRRQVDDLIKIPDSR